MPYFWLVYDKSQIKQDDGVFIMEYHDFLSYWEGVEKTQIFDGTWVQSSHWLNVQSRPLESAWQYGDVSCMYHRILIYTIMVLMLAASHLHYPGDDRCCSGSISVRYSLLQERQKCCRMVLRLQIVQSWIARALGKLELLLRNDAKHQLEGETESRRLHCPCKISSYLRFCSSCSDL